MHQETIKKALLELHKSTQGSGDLVAGDNQLPIDETRFSAITPNRSGNTVYIDGGEAELVGAPNFSLRFMRVSAVAYKDNKRVDTRRFESYVLLTLQEEQGTLSYKTTIYHSDVHVAPISLHDKTLSTGPHTVTISQAANEVRKLLELDLMCSIAETLEPGDLIVRDGDLEESCALEHEHFARLFHLRERGIQFCGLAKTTQAVTTQGSTANKALSRPGLWHYTHTKQTGFVRLHEQSAHIFRLDTMGDSTPISSRLAANSIDPIFFGYPYGLIEADRFARVTNKEKEYLQMVVMHTAQGDYKALEEHMRSMNAHSILDNIG